MIVEDDERVAQALTRGLSEAGFRVEAMTTAEEAIDQMPRVRPDLVVLDLGLPGHDGYHVLKALHAEAKHIPVIILTARDSIEDRVQGLDAGAEDYMVKPFAFAELLARIRARLRTNSGGNDRQLCVGDLKIDVVERNVSRADNTLDLTLKEFDLLKYLAENVGQVVSREMIARDVWQLHSRATPLDNVIDVHISHLRSKVDLPQTTPLIHTIRSVGFIMEERA